MREFINNFLGRLLVGVATTAVLGILGFVFGDWGFLGTCWKWLIAGVVVPRWWFWFSATALTVGCGGLVLAWVRARRQPAFLTYTEDKFLGLRWRWTYLGTQIDDLAAFCPKCDMRLLPHTEGYLQSEKPTVFRCSYCGHAATHDMTIHQLHEQVGLLIERTARQGNLPRGPV